MGQYLDQAMSPAVLNHAWRYFKNERGLWSRKLSVATMQGDLLKHVGLLSEEVLSGRYRAEPMNCFEIDKADGKKRLICSSAVRDRLVQRAILTVVEPLGEAMFHEASFGYRPHCTPDMAMAKVREWVRKGYVWLGDADIEQCFDQIPYEPALQQLQKLCGDKALVAVVQSGVESMPKRFRVGGRGRGLPQGMVLSPFLCNVYLHTLDVQLAQKGFPFVRFADDFVILAQDQATAERGLQVAGKQLQRLGLRLHPQKTRVIRSSPKHKFLGRRFPDSKPRFSPAAELKPASWWQRWWKK